MRLLKHRRLDGSYLLAIHLDEDRVVEDGDARIDALGLEAGDPDPDWVREYAYGDEPPETGKLAGEKYDPESYPDGPPMRRMGRAEYEEQVLAEATTHAREELARMLAADGEPPKGKRLAGEGAIL